MSGTVWASLLGDLTLHRYSGWFAFHNYNEPLADPTIFSKIAEVKSKVPNAQRAVYTNGDFRRRGEFHELVKLGVEEVRVTLYPAFGAEAVEPTWSRIEEFVNQIFPATALVDHSGPLRKEAHFIKSATRFVVLAPRVERYSNRANNVALEALAAKSPRSRPCFLPNWAAAFDVWGNLKLCCQIYDVTAIQQAAYLIGNVQETPFFELWHSSTMNAMRVRLAAADFSGLEGCAFCNHELRANDELDARASFQRLVMAPTGESVAKHAER